ncbi:uncharacterized protein F54F2.9 [Oratosquilla oratoria]|uniref:uncharacterized protein F54F2.9 n=1 Tax=Oratosquilla oratoria TaxID=337810 RepID=UPI003F759E51
MLLKLLYTALVVAVLAQEVCCWDTEEMEMFDLVEEINENFYEVMGISQNAELSEIKKAYRTLSKQIHPDKNDAPDAEVKFRQLVGIYDVLRDEKRRAQYDRVLVEGLPDWRSPIFYFRRVRKMSLMEIAAILTVVVSITQYLMAWGSYIDKKYTEEERLVKKYKLKDHKKKKNEDLDNILLMEAELNNIPRPSLKNILPIQIVRLVVFLVTAGPGLFRAYLDAAKKEKERLKREKELEEEEERRLKEEEERKKEKKAQRSSRKRVINLPDFSDGGCILDPVEGPEGEKQKPRPPTPPPVVTGGPWTDEDFSELARLMAKFPGGTSDRWERIAQQMGRTVFEVTKMSNKVKASLVTRPTVEPTAEIVPEIKVKQKTKGGKLTQMEGEGSNLEDKGADHLWSAVQQKALEKALVQHPKGTDQRWDKIARCVPEKTKEECMLRFKFLAERVKKKKEEEAAAKTQNLQETQEASHSEDNEGLKVSSARSDISGSGEDGEDGESGTSEDEDEDREEYNKSQDVEE